MTYTPNHSHVTSWLGQDTLNLGVQGQAGQQDKTLSKYKQEREEAEAVKGAGAKVPTCSRCSCGTAVGLISDQIKALSLN